MITILIESNAAQEPPELVSSLGLTRSQGRAMRDRVLCVYRTGEICQFYL